MTQSTSYKILYGDFGDVDMYTAAYYCFKIDNIDLWIKMSNDDILNENNTNNNTLNSHLIDMNNNKNIYKLTSFDEEEYDVEMAQRIHTYEAANCDNEILTISNLANHFVTIHLLDNNERTQFLNLMMTSKITYLCKNTKVIMFDNNIIFYPKKLQYYKPGVSQIMRLTDELEEILTNGNILTYIDNTNDYNNCKTKLINFSNCKDKFMSLFNPLIHICTKDIHILIKTIYKISLEKQNK